MVCAFPRACACRQTILQWFHILKALSAATRAKKQRQEKEEELVKLARCARGRPPCAAPPALRVIRVEPLFCSSTCSRKRKLPLLQKAGETPGSRLQKVSGEHEGAGAARGALRHCRGAPAPSWALPAGEVRQGQQGQLLSQTAHSTRKMLREAREMPGEAANFP